MNVPSPRFFLGGGTIIIHWRNRDMKKHLYKLLVFALSVCMVIGLMPAMTLMARADEGTAKMIEKGVLKFPPARSLRSRTPQTMKTSLRPKTVISRSHLARTARPSKAAPPISARTPRSPSVVPRWRTPAPAT